MTLDSGRWKRIILKCGQLGIKPTPFLLHASISAQDLLLFRDGQLVRRDLISTSRRPPDVRSGSEGTPTGLHSVADKIGDEEPIGMVFRGRKPVGRCYQEMDAEENRPNLITTRILRLRGLEPGHNAGDGVDSYERFIYIHGTNHEENLGLPSSAGCLLMGNRAVAGFFAMVPVGTLLLIEE